jgi:HSP20 family protein
MEHFTNGFLGRWFTRSRYATLAAPYPEIELRDRHDEMVLKAKVPGLEKADIHVTIDGNVLTLKGERKREKEPGDEDRYACETSLGRFSRSIELPLAVKPANITAALSSGVLEIHLPKAEEVNKNRASIEVK